jgi:hypothetical protein
VLIVSCGVAVACTSLLGLETGVDFRRIRYVLVQVLLARPVRILPRIYDCAWYILLEL